MQMTLLDFQLHQKKIMKTKKYHHFLLEIQKI